MSKDPFEERRSALEEGYFQRQSKELALRLKQRLGAQSMGTSAGVTDEDLLRRMADLGFGPETLSALSLVPLVYVAWADGEVSQRQRRLLLELAAMRGIGGEALGRVEKMLDRRPDRRFFDTTFAMIRAMHQGPIEDLGALALRVAMCSGGFFGQGAVDADERAAIERIAREIVGPRAAAAEDAVGKLQS